MLSTHVFKNTSLVGGSHVISKETAGGQTQADVKQREMVRGSNPRRCGESTASKNKCDQTAIQQKCWYQSQLSVT